MSIKSNQSKQYDYNVIQIPWKHNGVDTGVYGNFREDTGACLGTTSHIYKVIQNVDLVMAARANRWT